MLERLYLTYVNSFKGLRKEVWWLALVTLVNRAGTMVIPFLSLYLTSQLEFSLKDVGWIMSAFGLGSVVGAWFGGKLADRIGYYPVILWSLVISGLMFIGLQYIESFLGFCIAIFLLLVVADTLRPAIYVAINTYSKSENKTRSVTLIRLAINLGFTMGPAVGGIIIASVGYGGLFWLDGITCIGAGLLFIILLDKKQSKIESQKTASIKRRSPYTDKPYILFLVIVLLIGFSFMQLFSTVPLFYRDIHELSEEYIGILMGMNGLCIFIIEMPLIKYFERPHFSIYRILITSTILVALSFLVLNLTSWTGILVVGMFLITIGEMLNFPFLNRFALDRAEGGKQGAYMALFTMSFSMANIFSHNVGMRFIDNFGYTITWYLMTGILLVAAVLLIWLSRIIDRR